MTAQNKPREFWIDPMTLTLFVSNDLEHWIAWNKPVEEGDIHVIEYSAYQKSQEALKAALPLLETYQGDDAEDWTKVAEMVRKAIG